MSTGPEDDPAGGTAGSEETVDVDVVVVGSGITGLVFALETAGRASVAVITKKAEADSNTNYARGGVAAVLAPEDDPALHVRDTVEVGGGLCDPRVVEAVVREGPDRIRDLLAWGVRFHHREAGLHLGREGGHSRRRIVHAADRTGREIERALLEAVARRGVTIMEDHLAVELLRGEDPGGEPRCGGVLAFDHRRGRRVRFRAAATLLAAGGCGQIYRHTTNPAIATGDGVAMAHRAGARLANMEFVQFHPTALYPTEDPAFLLTEALRGEGAVLRANDGTAFMKDYDPQGSLAPRDVVARAVHREMKERGDDHVILDVSDVPPETMELRFPGAVEGCRARGIEPDEGIPAVPAAHYTCGGVRTDLEGRTSLPGLYAAGEVACTGMHGANRLASNSLLEAVVLSHRAAAAVLGELEDGARGRVPPEGGPDGDGDPAAGAGVSSDRIAEVRDRVRDLMWEKVGIVRSDRELGEAAAELDPLLRDEEERWCASRWSVEGAELRNLLRAARIVVECARRRKESRGLHYNVDHPERDDERFGRDTVLDPPLEPAEA